jgi:type I restriction enzyme S subunit
MKLETFFEKFDQFADAPRAVGKMRELVLQLAVQGRLVIQSPNDEPAEQLSERIREEKLRLAKNGKADKAKDFAPISEIARPYGLPESWTWVPLGNVTFIRTGKLDANASSPDGQYPFFTCARDPLRIDRYAYDGECVLLAGNGNFDVNYYDGKFEAYQRTYIIEGVSRDMINGGYLFRFIQKYADTLREMSVGGVISYIKIGFLTDAPLPLPPLAEQKRIVAKVDELMALCDRLEAQQLEREAQAGQLARASLARFADAPTPANLNLLFHSSFPISPSDLRKSILTLAVQGKLVPQDPNDESVEINSECESPFDIPSNWRWKPLERLGTCRTGKTPPTGDPTNYGLGLPFIGPGQITLSGRFTASEKSITRQGLENSTEANVGDILMVCIGGSIGKAAICREPIGFNQQINSVRLQRDLPEFVYLAVTADYFQDQVLANASGSATPIINKGKWEQIPIPIPPIAEQRRIVAKVSELMALVDELETQLAASRAAAEKLISALVAELTGTPSLLPADS